MSNKGNITTTENDPHPSDEAGQASQERPGGAGAHGKDIYPNDAIHDGKQRPNRGSEQGERPSK